MKSRIEKYLPVALSLVRREIVKNDGVAEEYDGYAASLGPSIIASGLLPAVSFYTDIHKDKESNKPHRFKILQLVGQILVQSEQKAIEARENGLLNFLISLPAREQETLKPLIMDAVVAVKLSLRNFKQVKSA